VNRFAIAALVVGAAAAGATAYLAYQRRAQPPVQSSVPAESKPAVLADRVPEFKLADRDGNLRSLADWQGKSLIVNFWATWCAPCRREIPLLRDLQQQFGPAGFQVIGIAADYRDKVVAYADSARIGYPLLIGEQDALNAAAAFGIQVIGFPFTVFSDASGRIIACHVGELTRPLAEVILDAVERVNQGRISPEAARSEIAAAAARLKPAGGNKG